MFHRSSILSFLRLQIYRKVSKFRSTIMGAVLNETASIGLFFVPFSFSSNCQLSIVHYQLFSIFASLKKQTI